MYDPLHELIADKALRRGPVMLASGTASTFFFDLKPVMLHPQGAYQIAPRVWDIACKLEVDAIGGPAIGAVPIIAATVAYSASTSSWFPGFYVRDAAKDHGMQRVIDGLDVKGLNVLLIEDVTTTGNSLLKAAMIVREHGGIVQHALTVVDRQEGAPKMLFEAEINLHAIFYRDDFL